MRRISSGMGPQLLTSQQCHTHRWTVPSPSCTVRRLPAACATSMAHIDAPPLACALSGWPGVSAQLHALSLAPPPSGAALVSALLQLRAALSLHPLDEGVASGMAAYFDAPDAIGVLQHRAVFLHSGGLAAVLAAAARLEDRVRESDARCAEAPLRLLRAGAVAATSLTRAAASSLLATAFLCLTPGAAGFSFPIFCFSGMWRESHYPNVAAKLDCHLHYFMRVANAPPSVLRFERRVLDTAAEANGWAAPLCRLHVEPNAGICTSHAPLRADFANECLGGGALTGGCVQEEILFSQRPECCVGMLLCEEMGDTEAIVMRGAACFSATEGYHRSLRWAGDAAAADAAPHDYVAFDALYFRERDAHAEWRESNLRRELRKALVAFATPGGGPAPGVATGNWGCGAFNGNAHLKALLQWAAASMAQCPVLHYHVYGEGHGALAPALEEAAQHVASSWPAGARTAGGLCAAVKRYAGRHGQPQPPLLTWLLSQDALEAALHP
jgi:poly(ADP-ribose) glycohydrolase